MVAARIRTTGLYATHEPDSAASDETTPPVMSSDAPWPSARQSHRNQARLPDDSHLLFYGVMRAATGFFAENRFNICDSDEPRLGAAIQIERQSAAPGLRIDHNHVAATSCTRPPQISARIALTARDLTTSRADRRQAMQTRWQTSWDQIPPRIASFLQQRGFSSSAHIVPSP